MAGPAVFDAVEVHGSHGYLIADPYLPRKARVGKLEEIRKCLACNFCRKRVIVMNRSFRCAVNPQTGQERERRILPASAPRKVLVVDGGPAGLELEAARVLALWVHRPALYEKRAELGGHGDLKSLPRLRHGASGHRWIQGQSSNLEFVSIP